MTKGPRKLANSKLHKTCEELDKAEIAQINGKIPSWLKGQFLRVGPAKFDFEDGFSVNHFLDGYSMISKFSIEEDKVAFEKKYLRSEAFERSLKANRPVITEFATSKFPDPNKGFLSRMISAVMPIELSDNNHQSLFSVGKELFSTSETCFFRQIEPKSLTTGEKFDTNKCFGTNIACAHPLFDEAGAMYNIGSTVITGSKYNIFRTPPPASNANAKDLFKKSQIICSIPSSWTGLMSYNHSFAMTSKHIILVEQPFVMNLVKAARTYLKNPAFREWLEWRPELKNRFFVVEKATGKLMKTEFISQDPFFFLHQINAYEEDDQVVIDIQAYPNPEVLDEMYLSKLRDGDLSVSSPGSCHRFVIPLVHAKDVPENVNLVTVKSDATAVRVNNVIILTPEVITEPGMELATVSRKVEGRKYSFFYSCGACSGTSFSYSVCKVDVKKKETICWRENEFVHPGEPIFVPNPEGVCEDDGVLISACTDSRESGTDFLLVLDAKSLTELGRAKFKAHIPLALHGKFINSNE